MSKWNTCKSCDDEEFQVIGGGIESHVSYCPWCGVELDEEADDEDLDDTGDDD